ncbi:MAG: DUF4338 domain-containing protein, partial [Deltaproteobacteria bacterium]|nr:DUF4338 domain-containing protein [Deltaproteobacteria bacterium]
HPEVRVPHLASHVLGKALRRLPHDWQSRYGKEPLMVETFVEGVVSPNPRNLQSIKSPLLK